MEAPNTINPPVKTVPKVGDYLHAPLRDRFKIRASYFFVLFQLKEKHNDYWVVFNLMTQKTQRVRAYDGMCERIMTERHHVVDRMEAAKILVATCKELNNKDLVKNKKAYDESFKTDLMLQVFTLQLADGIIPKDLL